VSALGRTSEPAERPPTSVDPACAAGLAIRYPQHAESPPRSTDGAGKRGGRHTSDPPIMDEPRDMQLQALRERVDRSEYEVDSQAVAGAILAKLLAGRTSPERPS
jgi:hypothetical protein